jgi:hypothetical protein
MVVPYLNRSQYWTCRKENEYVLAHLAQRAIWAFVITLHPSSSASPSSLKPLIRFGPNLAEMFIGRSSTRFVILVEIGNQTWLPGPIMCSDWLKLWKSSCQKLLSRWNCNIIEMMTGWSSTKFVIFVPIAYPRWPPQGNNSLLLDPMRISFKDLFLRNYLTNWIFCIMWMFLGWSWISEFIK